MKKAAIVLFALILSACAPTFDIVTYHDLSWVYVHANDMKNRCPDVTANEIHDKLLLRAKVAEQQQIYRKNAEDINDALALLTKSITSMANVYKTQETRPSKWYCENQLDLITTEVTRIKRGLAELEDVRNPLIP